MIKVPDKFLDIADKYMLHAQDWKHICSFTQEDLEAQFMSETFGNQYYINYNSKNKNGKYNGYAVGKHWIGVMNSYYIQDIRDGNFSKSEFKSKTKVENDETGEEKCINSEEFINELQSGIFFPFQK